MKKKNPPSFDSMPFTRLSRDLGYPAGFIDDGREILSQERQGARETMVGTRLPLDGTTKLEDVQRCEAIGIKLGKPIDDLFREATLPTGWKIAGSPDDHRTTILRDEKGSQRGYIWCKAAYYDRCAYLRIQTRYWAQGDYLSGNGGFRVVVYDRVEQKNIWEAPEILRAPDFTGTAEDWRKYEDAQQAQFRDAEGWLSERYPDWRNVAAYW